MIAVYRKLWDLFTSAERRFALYLMGLLVLSAFAEILGLSAFLFLLALLAQPEMVESNARISALYAWLGSESMASFQIAMAFGVLVVTVAGLAIKAGSAYSILRFSTIQGYRLSNRLLRAYLHQPYAWFLMRNTTEISKNVLGEIEQVVNRVTLPALRLVGDAILVVTILVFLLGVDPYMALGSIAIIGGAYGIIWLSLRNPLLRLGARILKANRERFRLIGEAAGGLKEIKLAGLEDSYARRFDGISFGRARATAASRMMAELPRFALEGLTFAVLLGVVLTLLFRQDGNLAAIVPTLGIFAFSVMRMLPAMQRLFAGLSTIRSGRSSLDYIHHEYLAVNGPEMAFTQLPKAADRLDMRQALELDGVDYSYQAASRQALSGASLRIEANTAIGIVGSTGAGKTTLIDVILGLLTPDGGEIRVDGTVLGPANIREWQRSLGYVPQTIYLTDSTLAANIAFGIAPDAIDMDAVIRSAKVAALHDFVIDELPDGYQTRVGERGVRLSGGQRQRIGIARALYHDPSFLILDEATSALDNITESIVMEAVQEIRHDKTVVLIAHRLSTVRNCDVIFLMEHGRVSASGTYDDLVAGSPTFRRMAATA